MKNSYKLKALLSSTLMCIMMVFANSINAQVSAYTFAQSNGTYTPITGGTAQWSITSTTRPDDNSTAALPLGFTFVYAGVSYTTVGVNNNGLLVFGGGGVTDYSGIGGTTNNIITPLGDDLAAGYRMNATRTTGSPDLTVATNTTAVDVGDICFGTGIPAGTTVVSKTVNTVTLSANATTSSGTGTYVFSGGGVRTEVLGVTPNQIFVAQWTDMSSFGTNNQSLDFQVRLYEGTNIVEIVYGECYYTGTLSDDATIGLRGASGADFNNRNAATDINASVAGTTNADLCFYNSTAFVAPANGLTFTWTPPLPCSGTPAAGITAGPSSVCSGVNFVLSLTGATTGVAGLAYQWQSSPDGVTYTNIAATGSTATVSQTAATFYQAIVTCTPSGIADTSAPLSVTMNAPATCYCTVTFPSSIEPITLVNLGTINNVTSPTVGGTPALENFTAISTSLGQGTSSTITVKGNTDGAFTTNVMTYVDWNQDGDFVDAGESFNCGSITNSTGVDAIQTTGTITVPMSALLGNTRMRVIKKFSTVPGPCESAGFGQAEDYTINVTLPPPCISVSGVTLVPTGPTAGTLSWTCVSCTGSFIVEYGPAGFTPGAGATAGAGGTIASSAAVSPFSLTGLAPTTVSDVYVRQDCGGAGFGGNSTVVKFIPGDVCANAIDLGALVSPISSTTTGAANDFTNTCASGNVSPDLIYTIQVPDLYTLVIGQTINGYDSENTLFYGGACPGTTQIGCFDDPDVQNITWQNTTGSTQTVYWVQDGWNAATDNGTFTLAWTLTAPPACPAPSALTATAITATTATLNWNCPSCTGSYSIEYGPTGFTLGTGTIVTSGVGTVNITGLTAGTTYQYYVTQDCSAASNGFSTVTGPASFTTSPLGDNVCAPIVLTFGANGPYSNAGASVETGEPAPPGTACNTQTAWCNNTLENSIWFSFVAPASGRVSITTPGFDTQLALWSAATCGDILTGGATLIAANDDGGPSFSSVINPVNCLTPGTTYYVQLDGYNGTAGSTLVNLTDLGAADPSFTGLPANACTNGATVTLAPTVSGGVFAGTGVTGSTFDPVAAGAGTYSVTYTLNGCYTSTQSVTVNVPPVATSAVTATPPCTGGTGTVTVSATGGMTPYTGVGAMTAPAGPYSYMVTDAFGCVSLPTTGTMTEPTVITVMSSGTVAPCVGSAANVVITGSGGTPPYTSGEGTFPQTAAAGAVTYTVTDFNGCTGMVSVTVTDPAPIAVTATPGTIACFGGSTSVAVSATGGTGTYPTGTGTMTQSAGTTVYTVTDANGCTGTASVTISQPALLVATSSETSAIACNGGMGTVTVLATGGTAAYSGTGAMPQAAGATTYTVTDANGCSATTTTTLTEPTSIVVSYSETGVMCNGGFSSVTVSVTGGTPSYQIPFTSGSNTFAQSASTVTYNVTDANGCTGSAVVTVTEPAVLAATSTATSTILCNGGTATVDVVATGGTTPYAVGTTGTFNQSAGTTVYTVTDANGCSTTSSTTLTEPTAVMVMTSFSPIMCNGDSTSVTVTAMDGTPGYTGLGSFFQLAGTTTYTVTDANGCVGAANVAITQPAAIASAQSFNFCGSGSVTVGSSTYTTAGTYTDILTAANACDSTVTTTVTVTTIDVTTTTSLSVITANSAVGAYQWINCGTMLPISGANTQSYTATADGSYAVEITDNGCVDTSACVMIIGAGIADVSLNTMTVSPNPTLGAFNINIENANIAELMISVVDIQGKEVFTSTDKNVNGSFNKQINIEDIAKGLYYIKVNTGSEVKIQKLIVQ